MASSANRHHSARLTSRGENQQEEEEEQNYTMLQGFEWYTPGGGQHWRWLADNAERLADMGITAIWIPPPTKGASQDGTGYDIYDLWDLGEFSKDGKGGGSPDATRNKYGTRKEMEDMMAKLREKGISIYVDAVLNHKMGADQTEVFQVQQVDDNNRKKSIGEPHDIEGWTKYTFPGRKGKYSQFEWNFQHFTGVDYDNRTGDKGVFRVIGKDKHFAEDTDTEKGGFDYLMGSDIDHAHPDVAAEIIAWGKWMVRTFPLAGFRYDAVKHYSRAFAQEFVAAVREEARKVRAEQGKKPYDEEAVGPPMFGVGEYWSDDTEACLKYLGEFGNEQFSLFDAPLHYNFKEAGDKGHDADLRKIFDGTLVQARPVDAVTLVENHDTQAGQALASVVSAQFKPMAYATILLRKDGYPCVFLGDLDGCHADGDPHGQPSVPPMSGLAKFIKARKYFAFGEQRDYWDHPSCVGWVRMGSEQNPDGCAVVIGVSDAEGTKRMEVGKERAGKVYVEALGWMQGVEITVGEDGWAEFRSPAHSVGIWVPKDAARLSEMSK